MRFECARIRSMLNCKPEMFCLEFEVAVHRYQHLETSLRPVEKFAALNTSPAQTGNGSNLVTR